VKDFSQRKHHGVAADGAIIDHQEADGWLVGALLND
jgi:hypothetical protein